MRFEFSSEQVQAAAKCYFQSISQGKEWDLVLVTFLTYLKHGQQLSALICKV